MRAVIGVLYWFLVGVLALFALYLSVAGNRLIHSWWLIPAALILFGAWWPGLRYVGVGLIVFGAYPALFVTGGVVDQILNPSRPCPQPDFGGVPRPPGGGDVGCGGVSIDLLLLGLGLWTVALVGAILLLRRTPSGSRDAAHPPATSSMR